MAYEVKFNNVLIPSYVKVTSVSYSALPEINTKMKQLPNRRGLLDVGTDFGPKQITLQFNIVPSTTDNVMEQTALFVTWLKGDNFKLCELWTSDQSDRSYVGRVNNLVDISDDMFIGKGTVEFIIPSGTSFKAGTPYTTTSNTVNYTFGGTAVGYPVIEFTPSATFTNTLTFSMADGQVVKAIGTFVSGTKYTFDCEKRQFKIGTAIDMSWISIDTTWIEFQTAKQYTLTKNYAGSVTINAQVNNY